MRVIKRTGKKEDWNERKLRQSIMNAAEDAGLTGSEMDSITQKVFVKIDHLFKDEEEVTSYLIRNEVLKELDEEDKRVADAWRIHEMKKWK